MIYQCVKCQYQWTPRPARLEGGREKPVKCPRCLSIKWDEPTS